MKRGKTSFSVEMVQVDEKNLHVLIRSQEPVIDSYYVFKIGVYGADSKTIAGGCVKKIDAEKGEFVVVARRP